MSPSPVVSATLDVDAPPSAVFAVLADPRRHHEIDGSGTVRSAVRGPRRLRLGARFVTGMRMGLPYVVPNTVVEFEEERLIAWHHLARVRWRYRLEPLDGGTRTRVTEEWDPTRSPVRRVLARTGTPAWAQKAVRGTLPRLAAAASRPAG